MTLGEVREVIHNCALIEVFDREKDGCIFTGEMCAMKTSWDNREVKWLEVSSNKMLKIEIE